MMKACKYLGALKFSRLLFCLLGLLPLLVSALIFIVPSSLYAQTLSLDFGEGAGFTERVLQLMALVTVLSLAPSILIMVTSFTRIIVALSLLRSAIGAQATPPNSVLISLALFLTAFIMAPTFEKAYNDGIVPLLSDEIDLDRSFSLTSEPFRVFMLAHVRETDLILFQDMAGESAPENPEDIGLRVLVPAFMISELRRAFEIGFLLFLPFLVIDLVVAAILMSMGMMMLPPVVISLPFKLIFFVLVDGWHLVVGSLTKSYLSG